MKNMKFNFDINAKKIYNAEEIVKDFPKYFGIEFSKMKENLKNYKTITKDDMINYVKTNHEKMAESKSTPIQEIIEKRRLDYDYFKKVLAILSDNAKIYLLSLEYMANLENIREQTEEIEEVIEKLNIYHLGKAVTGESINNIFLHLAHLLIFFQTTLEKINNLETYHIQTLDSFAINYMGESAYPVSIVSEAQNAHLIEYSLVHRKTKKHSK